MLNYTKNTHVSTSVPLLSVSCIEEHKCITESHHTVDFTQTLTSPIGAIVPKSTIAASSYAIGPMDPTHLLTLQAGLSYGRQIRLLVPASLPHSLLSHPKFKDGYESGYLDGGTEEEWTILQVVNHIWVTLYTELLNEWSPSTYAWIIGYLVGDLAYLAETESMLASVGMAHLCFLLISIPQDTPSCDCTRRLMSMDSPHHEAVRAYRARVRFYRETGMSLQDAQRKALEGDVTRC
jgi:hypothetical protein